MDDSVFDGRIGDDNWRLLESRLLFLISESTRDEHGTIPYFGNIQTRNGYKILFCKNEDTLNWLRNSVTNLDELWEGAKLKLVPQNEIPNQPRIRLFVMGPILPKDRLLKMLVAQNAKTYPSTDWKILKMEHPTDAGRSIILAVKSETLLKLDENGHRISVGLSSAIAKPILDTEERLKINRVRRND